MIFIACGTQHTVVRTAPVAPIASTTADGIVLSLCLNPRLPAQHARPAPNRRDAIILFVLKCELR
jgi:hypothetical protein